MAAGEMEFSTFNSDVDGNVPSDSIGDVPIERPRDLRTATAAAPSGRGGGESTPLREEQRAQRQKDLRSIVAMFFVVSVGVTLALLVHLVAGHGQLEPHGTVVSPSDECSKVGVEILEKKKGNAVDAALATVLCIGVSHPQFAGLGGGGFMIVYDHKPDRQNSTLLDFREQASASYPTGLEYKEIFKKFGLGIGVPGELKGIYEAHRRFGKLKWSELFLPAIEMAERGFVVYENHVSDLDRRSGGIENAKKIDGNRFEEVFGKMRNIPLKTRLPRADLAALLKKIASDGPKAFYEGSVAEEIVSAVTAAGGYMTLEDLKNYTVHERQPITTTLEGGYKILAFPAPAAGSLLLRIVKSADENEKTLLHNEHTDVANLQRIQHLMEVLKNASACRAALGDPHENSDVATNEKAIIDLSAALPEQCAGGETEKKQLTDSHGTSHISVIDNDELMVSITTTINWWYGSMVLTKSGVLLNNELADFGGTDMPFNRPGPNKRPLSSTAPTIVVHQTKGCLKRIAIGGVNGSHIYPGVAQVLINTLVLGYPPQYSIDKERVYCTPDNCTISDPLIQFHPTKKHLSDVPIVDYPLSVVAMAMKDANNLTTVTQDYGQWDFAIY